MSAITGYSTCIVQTPIHGLSARGTPPAPPPLQPKVHTGCGVQALLIDGIHDHLDSQRPGNTPRASIQKLRQTIRAAFVPAEQLPGSEPTAQFVNITAKPDQRYALRLADGSTVDCSQEEIELHILLQSQVRQAEANPVDQGDSLSPEFLRRELSPERQPDPRPQFASAAAGPGPAPVQASNSVDFSTIPAAPAVDDLALAKPYGDAYRYFDGRSIDLQAVDNRTFGGDSHKIKQLSAEGNNCWWRGGILAALFQKGPGSLRSTLARELAGNYPGDDRKDIEDFCKMGAAARNGNLSGILTNMYGQDLAADFDNGSRLKLDSDGDPDGAAGEALCKRIVKKLLLNAGQSEDVVDAAIDNFKQINGNNNMVQLLLKRLDCNYACINYAHDESSDRMEVQGMEVGAQPGNALARLIVDPTRPPSTAGLFDQLQAQRVPILIFGGSHFNIAFANSVIFPLLER
ncbi:MAG: hypothetical protein H7327_05580 [Herminiimonas sp.]|nr:hypothetical protein [Herminiimonas sp.]